MWSVIQVTCPSGYVPFHLTALLCYRSLSLPNRPFFQSSQLFPFVPLFHSFQHPFYDPSVISPSLFLSYLSCFISVLPSLSEERMEGLEAWSYGPLLISYVYPNQILFLPFVTCFNTCSFFPSFLYSFFLTFLLSFIFINSFLPPFLPSSFHPSSLLQFFQSFRLSSLLSFIPYRLLSSSVSLPPIFLTFFLTFFPFLLFPYFPIVFLSEFLNSFPSSSLILCS